MVKFELDKEEKTCICTSHDDKILGYEGEHKANTLVFDFKDEFVDGVACLNVKRGDVCFPIELTKEGISYIYEVERGLLTENCKMEMQVQITTAEGNVYKFEPFAMEAKDALDIDSEMPEELPSWIDTANAKLAEVDVAIENAEAVGNQLLEDKENGVFDGKDGVSPTITTQQTSTGATITIKDATGTHTATLLNGKDGKDGNDGLTPHIGDNGNWWIGDTDTGVKASGSSEGGGSSPKETVLFEGEGTPSTTITLSDNASNYDVVRIEGYSTNADNEIMSYYTKDIPKWLMEERFDSNLGVEHTFSCFRSNTVYVSLRLKLYDTSLKIETVVQAGYSGGSTVIRRIVGIKY